jgi:hypothetical protein
MGELAKPRARPTRLKFSTCVDSIRDNFRRISGINKHGSSKRRGEDSPRKERVQVVEEVSNGVSQSNQRNRHHRRKSSFELFLSTIPKIDPVDRTVGWVMMQPDNHVSASYLQCISRIDNYGYPTG